MIPLDKVKHIVDRYKILEDELASGKINKKDFVSKSKEYSSIGEVIEAAKGYINFKKDKVEIEKIVNDKKSDKDMIELANNELKQLSKNNDINEKAIIGFISFFLMTVFGICDLVTAFMGQDLVISDTIYTSFVIVTLGAFGISEAGKAFGSK